MSKTIVLLLGWLLMLAAAVSPGFAEMDYQVNFVVGQKTLDEDDWVPLDEQAEFGVATTFGKEGWPVHIALDALASSDDLSGIEATTTEFDVGIRKIWGNNNAKPFLGGGLAFVNGEIEVLGFPVDGDGVGAWIDGGVFWRLGRRFNIGIEARVSRAEISIASFDIEAGGEHLGLILGFGKAR